MKMGISVTMLTACVAYSFLWNSLIGMHQANVPYMATDADYRRLTDKNIHLIIYGYCIDLWNEIENNPTAITLLQVLHKLNQINTTHIPFGTIPAQYQAWQQIPVHFNVEKLKFSPLYEELYPMGLSTSGFSHDDIIYFSPLSPIIGLLYKIYEVITCNQYLATLSQINPWITFIYLEPHSKLYHAVIENIILLTFETLPRLARSIMGNNQTRGIAYSGLKNVVARLLEELNVNTSKL